MNTTSILYFERTINIQSDVDFHNEEDRKSFYKRYIGYEEPQRISHNHRKVPTIYCGPK